MGCCLSGFMMYGLAAEYDARDRAAGGSQLATFESILSAYSWLYYDENGDGVVSEEEFVTMMAIQHPEIKEDELRAKVAAMDTNSDGVLQFEEMVAFMTGNESTQVVKEHTEPFMKAFVKYKAEARDGLDFADSDAYFEMFGIDRKVVDSVPRRQLEDVFVLAGVTNYHAMSFGDFVKILGCFVLTTHDWASLCVRVNRMDAEREVAGMGQLGSSHSGHALLLHSRGAQVAAANRGEEEGESDPVNSKKKRKRKSKDGAAPGEGSSSSNKTIRKAKSTAKAAEGRSSSSSSDSGRGSSSSTSSSS